MKKLVSSAFVTLLAVVLSGCNSQKPVFNAGVFDSDGIPKQQYLVGGGLNVEYEAPQDGMIYWVDNSSKRIIISRSMDEGDTFEEAIPLDEEATLKVLFSDGDVTNVKMGLYFVPEPEVQEEVEQD